MLEDAVNQCNADIHRQDDDKKDGSDEVDDLSPHLGQIRLVQVPRFSVRRRSHHSIGTRKLRGGTGNPRRRWPRSRCARLRGGQLRRRAFASQRTSQLVVAGTTWARRSASGNGSFDYADAVRRRAVPRVGVLCAYLRGGFSRRTRAGVADACFLR